MKGFDYYADMLAKAGAVPCRLNKHGWTRRYELNALGQVIEFIVFKNRVYAAFGLAVVVCDDLSIDGCWPNRYKTNLNMIYGGNVCCVIPIAKWSASPGQTDVAQRLVKDIADGQIHNVTLTV